MSYVACGVGKFAPWETRNASLREERLEVTALGIPASLLNASTSTFRSTTEVELRKEIYFLVSKLGICQNVSLCRKMTTRTPRMSGHRIYTIMPNSNHNSITHAVPAAGIIFPVIGREAAADALSAASSAARTSRAAFWFNQLK